MTLLTEEIRNRIRAEFPKYPDKRAVTLPALHIVHEAFRAVSPLFSFAPFDVCGAPRDDNRAVDLWAKNMRGELAMEATAALNIQSGVKK